MKTRFILSVIILGLGMTAAVLPGRQNNSIALNESQLLQEMLSDANYVSSDELASLIINGDPSIQLIDVRPAKDFKNPLRGAINVPLDSIFEENYAYLFDQSVMKNIIYSQDDVIATQVWTITKQLGYQNNYLLEGGINGWNKTILDPPLPNVSDPKEAFDLYEKRAAAKMFFTGVKALPAKDSFKPLIPVKGRKKKKVEGGCS